MTAETKPSIGSQRYRIEVPELGLVSEGAELDRVSAAMEQALEEIYVDGGVSRQALEQMRARVHTAAASASRNDELPGPSPSRVDEPVRSSGSDPLTALIAGMLLGVVLGAAGSSLSILGTVSDGLTRTRDLGRTLSAAVDRAARAAETITPEQREKIRADLRTIVSTLSPFVQELRPLFDRAPHVPSEAARSAPDEP